MTLYYRMRQIWSQNVTAILLQNATVITKCDDFITKCNSNYNIKRLLQIASVHPSITQGFFHPDFTPYNLQNEHSKKLSKTSTSGYGAYDLTI